MTAFWEANFLEKKEMWGFEPANSAILAMDFFVRHSVKNILIPGIGYGRNAQIFINNGITVTGIEISKTAIALAQKHYGTRTIIHNGSVTDMPFDNNNYDGIFCYALIHLLDSDERQKLIRDCYDQLKNNGYMFFTALSKKAPTYGKGKCVGEDRYELFEGAQMYFYDEKAVRKEFEKVGLFEIIEINENHPFFFVMCKKGEA
jgi:SAM-dependent methyltransferase